MDQIVQKLHKFSLMTDFLLGLGHCFNRTFCKPELIIVSSILHVEETHCESRLINICMGLYFVILLHQIIKFIFDIGFHYTDRCPKFLGFVLSFP